MELPIFTVDAFTSSPFEGNPASVCIIKPEQVVEAAVMQSIAREMNLSETAFIQLTEPNANNSESVFGLRWFTPTTEVNLCGHATLASAAVLYKHYPEVCHDKMIRFSTLSGILTAEKNDGLITLDLPLADISDKVPESAAVILQNIEFSSGVSVGAKLSDCKLFYSPKTKKLVVRLPDEWSRSMLESIPVPVSADMLKVHDGTDIRGVILTLSGGGADGNNKPYDFVSRYFAPWVGIQEDPVTGSAHTVLGKYWKEELGKSQLYAGQCSSRGGNLTLNVNEESGRILVAGEACIVLTGKFIL